MCNASAIDAVLPLRGAPNETPHSRFEGGKPNVTHIRVFGCRAYPTTLDPKFKFGEKVPRGIYLGRWTTQPAYTVYIPEINKIVTMPKRRLHRNYLPRHWARRYPEPRPGAARRR